VDLITEYVAGFAVGLFVFQALFLKRMFGSYGKALRRSFLPEWLSMNMMMTGMVPVMVAGMMGRDMRAMEPSELLYWGVMSAGVTAGFVVAYPVNLWMVAVNLKHGLMTERKPKGDHGHGERQNTREQPADAPVAPQHGVSHAPGVHHAGGV
jgi:manganese oxidase